MHRTAISTRGRVTIPADLRERLGIKPGTHVGWSEEKGRLVLTMTSPHLKKSGGFSKGESTRRPI